MANQVHFEPMPIPLAHPSRQYREDLVSGASSFHSSYGLLPFERSRTPSGLRIQDLPLDESDQITQESIPSPTLVIDCAGLVKSNTLHNDRHFSLPLDTKSRLSPNEHYPIQEGDISSYGGAPGRRTIQRLRTQTHI